MRHKEHRDQRLADGEPHGGPPAAAAAQQRQHGGQQRGEHDVLHHTHTRVGHQAQQRPQPDQVPVPVPRVGERLQPGLRHSVGVAALPRGQVGGQVRAQRLEIVDVVGGVGHQGGQRGGLVGGGGFHQHQGVGIVVHLEQLEAEKRRVQPLVHDRCGRGDQVRAHGAAGQRIRAQQQRKQQRQRNAKHRQRAQCERRPGFLRLRHTIPRFLCTNMDLLYGKRPRLSTAAL